MFPFSKHSEFFIFKSYSALQSDESFCNLMNHIGNHAPDHESVGLIYPDWSEVFVPWDEPAEGTALIHLELLDGEFAIHEGDDEVAVGWLYLSVYDG